MFNKVIIGIDEHDGGRDAIALAGNLVDRDGGLTLAYIHGGFPEIARSISHEFEASERARAKTLLERVRDEAGVKAEILSTGCESVGRGLHELAESIGADLLVIGSTRHSAAGRVLVGDDTRAALNGAPCAIAIAPAGYAKNAAAMREIGVAYNGSAESEHAIALAKRIAEQHAAKVSAFEAVSLPTYAFAGVPLPTEDDIQEIVDDALERISAHGVEAHAVYGPAGPELAVYGASLDLLVLGSRDYGPIGRLVHGSTSHDLAHSAPCPILVLTRAARAATPLETLTGEQPAQAVTAAG